MVFLILNLLSSEVMNRTTGSSLALSIAQHDD